MNVHTSFLALTQAEIDAHVDELVNEHVNGPERARVLTYLNQTLAKDRLKVRQYRRVLARARQKVDAVYESAPIDFAKHTSLFAVDSSDRFTRMKAKLLVDGSDVRGQSGLEVSETLVINGDNVQLDGISNGLKAVDETLTCGLKVTGLCTIEGANIRVRGVHFVTPAGSGQGDFPDDISQGIGFILGQSNNVIGETLSAFRTDSGELVQLLDQPGQ